MLSASAQLSGPSRDPNAANVIRRAYHVLFAVAGVLVLVALCIMALDGWAALVGFSSGPDDRWAITVAACIFALTIPAGLGLRILIGIDRNPLATLVLMSCPAFALGVTLVLYVIGASRYLVCGLGVGRLAHRADRRHGAGAAALRTRLVGVRPRDPAPQRVPTAGRQHVAVRRGGRVCRSACRPGGSCSRTCRRPMQLSQYALMAQIYAVCWSGVVHRGLGLLADLREEAGSHRRDRSNVVAADRDVRRDRGDRHAALMVPLGPWAATVLSGGRIDVSVWLALAFGVLLVGQAVHLPANVLLTRPNEARWQALWTLAMAAISIGLGCAAAAAVRRGGRRVRVGTGDPRRSGPSRPALGA